MNKISKFKYWILSFSILSVLSIIIGCTVYYFSEKERLIKEAYPYPTLYDAAKQKCTPLINGNKYVDTTTRDTGLSLSGESSFKYNNKMRRFELMILKTRLIIFFVKENRDGDLNSLKMDAYEGAITFDKDDVKFVESLIDIPQPDSTLKKAFEKEMIERLKSC